jgi:hypothetical protein
MPLFLYSKTEQACRLFANMKNLHIIEKYYML